MEGFKEYSNKPKTVFARELDDSEIIRCYNGVRIGKKGEFVVVDEQDRTMIMKRDKFLSLYGSINEVSKEENNA